MQIVKFTNPPQARVITPRNPAKQPFTIYEQRGVVYDDDGSLHDMVFRAETPEGYAPGEYRAKPPQLRRGDFDAAEWERRVELVAKPDAVSGKTS